MVKEFQKRKIDARIHELKKANQENTKKKTRLPLDPLDESKARANDPEMNEDFDMESFPD